MSDPQALTHLLPSGGLTAAEIDFVYNAEVLGLPVRKAINMAGVCPSTATKPHIVEARDLVKRALRGTLNITKEDVIHGYMDAIGRAKALAEPMVEIVGWEKIAKLLGFDTPQKVDINLRSSVEVLTKQVRDMSDEELMKALGAGSVIDAEFHEIGKDREA